MKLHHILINGLTWLLTVCLIMSMCMGMGITVKAASYSSITSDTTLSDGDTLSGTLSGCTVTVPAGATVTVTGQITISGTVAVVGGGTLKRGGSFTGASMISVGSGATLNIGTSGGVAGVTLDGNSVTVTANGGAINNNGGTVNLYNGASLINHKVSKANPFGGAVYVLTGTLNMFDGALVCNNSATPTSSTTTYGGGGIAIYENAFFNMFGGTISGNSAPSNVAGTGGGGVYCRGTFVMSGGTISGNSTGRNGGAVHLDGGDNTVVYPVMTMTGGLISGNTSTTWAGGIEILSKAGLTITGGKINSNSCGSGGGGIELDAVTGSPSSDRGGYLKVGGDAQITGNMRGSLQDNVYIDKNVTITGNFTGSIGITHETASVNSVNGIFATNNGGYSGMENFFCNGKSLVGTLSGTSVMWKTSTTALTGITLSTNTPSVGAAVTTTLSPSGATATYQWYRNSGSSNSGGTIIVGATDNNYTPTADDVGKYLYVIANGTGGCTGQVLSAAATSAVQYGSKVAEPTFNIAAGTYSGSQSVTLSCLTDGADIYYTTNGSTPTTGGTKYTGPITVASTATIKAIAVKSGCADSDISDAAYNIINVTVTAYSGIYDGSAHNAVSLSGTQAGDTVTYSTDGAAFAAACPQLTDAGSYSVYVKVQRSGVVWASSLNTAVISCAAVSGSLSIPATIVTGTVVSADISGVVPSADHVSYQWKIDGTAISGATGSSYTVKSADYGKTLTVQLTGNGNYTGSLTSNEVTVGDGDAPTGMTVRIHSNAFTSFLHAITFGLFFSNTVDVSLSASDTASGVDYYEYQLVDTSKNQNYSVSGSWVKSDSGTFSIPAQFKGAVYAYVVDKAGNHSDVVSSNGFVSDHQAPTAPTVNETVNGSSYGGTWTSGNVRFTVSGSSALSGINSYEYSTDTGNTWAKMPDQSGAKDSTTGNAIADRLTLSLNMNGSVYFRAISNAGVAGDETIVTVKRDSVTPLLQIGVSGTTGQWTADPVAFTLSNTANNISPVTFWVKTGSDDWSQISGSTYQLTGNVNTTCQFKAVSASGLESAASGTYTVKLAGDIFKEVVSNIDRLPDPDQATDRQITDNSQQIKDAKILYDFLSKEEQSAIGQSRADKLDQLLYRLSALLVIIPKDPNTGIIANNIGTAVQLPELNDPAVGKVVVKLVVNAVTSFAQSNIVGVVSASLDKSGKNLVATYNVSLFKSVFDSAGNQTSYGKVNNSNIVGAITVCIPVPAGFEGRNDLQVIYIDDAGDITPLPTTLVTMDGVQYLQFTTTHFSQYAVMAAQTVANPKTGDDHGNDNVWWLIIAGGTALYLFRTRKFKCQLTNPRQM